MHSKGFGDEGKGGRNAPRVGSSGSFSGGRPLLRCPPWKPGRTPGGPSQPTLSSGAPIVPILRLCGHVSRLCRGDAGEVVSVVG